MEAVLARGDRKVGKVILDAYNQGCIFDSWSEFFDPDKWYKAFENVNVNKDNYTKKFDDNDVLAWDFIDIGVTKKFLLKERHLAYQNKCSGGCQTGCKGCGLKGRCNLV